MEEKLKELEEQNKTLSQQNEEALTKINLLMVKIEDLFVKHLYLKETDLMFLDNHKHRKLKKLKKLLMNKNLFNQQPMQKKLQVKFHKTQ